MRASTLSLGLMLVTTSAAVFAAACSSSSSPAPSEDGGNSSSSGGSSSGSSGSSSSGCAYTSTADLTTPTVSFKTDVLPIFEHSCGISSSCHGDRSDVGQRGIFLGCDIAKNMNCVIANPGPEVYAAVVGSADAGPDAGVLTPLEIDGMPFITAGDPSNSFLMRKMDGDVCTLMGCKANNVAVVSQGDTPTTGAAANWCGTSMPLNNALLDVSARDTVRRWIKQGALNN